MRKFFPAIALLLALGLSVPVLAGPLEEVLAIYNFNEKILDQINQEINEEERSVFFNKPRSVVDESSLLSSRPILLDSPATGSTLQPIIQPNPTQDLNGAGTALDAKKDPLSSKALFNLSTVSFTFSESIVVKSGGSGNLSSSSAKF